MIQNIFPYIYLITPDPEKFSSLEFFLSQLVKSLSNGIKIVQLHSNMLDEDRYQIIAWGVKLLCLSYDARLVLNGPASQETINFADGMHLNSKKLLGQSERPIEKGKLLSATCENIEQLRHAEKIGVDIITLSPMKEREIDPSIGWETLEKFTFLTTIPIFASGGMSMNDLIIAQKHGAYGIAGISNFWNIENKIEYANSVLFH